MEWFPAGKMSNAASGVLTFTIESVQRWWCQSIKHVCAKGVLHFTVIGSGPAKLHTPMEAELEYPLLHDERPSSYCKRTRAEYAEVKCFR